MEQNDPMNGHEQPKKTQLEKLNEDIAKNSRAFEKRKYEVTGRELMS